MRTEIKYPRSVVIGVSVCIYYVSVEKKTMHGCRTIRTLDVSYTGHFVSNWYCVPLPKWVGRTHIDRTYLIHIILIKLCDKMEEELHPFIKKMLGRTDDWPGANPNESSLDYDYLTRHPTMSAVFLCVTGFAIIAGTTGNILVSKTHVCSSAHSVLRTLMSN